MKPLYMVLSFAAIFLAVAIPSLLAIARSKREKTPQKQERSREAKTDGKSSETLGVSGDRLKKLGQGFLLVIALIGLWYFFQAIAVDYLVTIRQWSARDAKIILAILAPLITGAVWKLSMGALPGKASAIAGAAFLLSVSWLGIETYDFLKYPKPYFNPVTGQAEYWIDDTGSKFYGRFLKKGKPPENERIPVSRLTQKPLRLLTPADTEKIRGRTSRPEAQRAAAEKRKKWVLHWTRPNALKGLVKEPEMYLETKILRWDNEKLQFTTYFLSGGKAAENKLKQQSDGSYFGSWKDIYGQKGTIWLSKISPTLLTGWMKNKGRKIKIPTELQLR